LVLGTDWQRLDFEIRVQPEFSVEVHHRLRSFHEGRDFDAPAA
jgi:hypothetical protein